MMRWATDFLGTWLGRGKEGMVFRCSGCGKRWCNDNIFRFRRTFRVHKVRCPGCGGARLLACSLDSPNLHFIPNRDGKLPPGGMTAEEMLERMRAAELYLSMMDGPAIPKIDEIGPRS